MGANKVLKNQTNSVKLSSEQVDQALEGKLREDNFRVDDRDFGQEMMVEPIDYRIIKGKEVPFIVYRLQNGKRVVLSTKRYLSSAIVEKMPRVKLETLPGTKHCYAGETNSVLWAEQKPLHTFYGLKKGEEFPLPSKIKLVGAIMTTDRLGQPKFGNYSYIGYRTCWIHYNESGRQMSWDNFVAELKTTKDRIPGLPIDIQVPTIKPEVLEKPLPTDYGFILLFENIS